MNFPELDRPVMLMAFAGWNDAGDAATGAIEYLNDIWSAHPFATIDAEEYFDFTATRPTVELTSTGGRRVVWPNTSFSYAKSALGGRDVVLVSGTEPHLKWKTFSRAILNVVEKLDASMVITFGALLADVPHSRPTIVYGAAAGDAVELAELEVSRYEGPTGIVGVLHSAFAIHGVNHASLWGAVPTYVPNSLSPKATHAVLERLGDLFDTEIELDDIKKDAEEYVRQVDDYVAADPDAAEFVAELEVHYDSNNDTSPEQLVAEVEQFLRQRGEI